MPLPSTEYPIRPSVPLADRCTISRSPSPGVRPMVPWAGRLRTTPSREGIRDVYKTGRYKGEVVVTTGDFTTVDLGLVEKECRSGRIGVQVYDSGEGSWLSADDVATLLSAVDFHVMANGRTLFSVFGGPAPSMYATPFTMDVQGGESLKVRIDNSDIRSTLNGETIVIQAFLDYEPFYQIEESRKGNPHPSV